MIVEWNCEIFLTVFIVLGTIWLMGRVLVLNDVLYIPNGQKKRHSWKPIKYLDRASFCNVCEILIGANGGFCDCCGVCACQTCMKKADCDLKCKDKVLKADAVLRHHWIHGNLPLNSDCCVCGEDIDLEHTQPGLYGYRCCWCQRSTHNHCYPRIESEDQCDLGTFKDMIIPPNKLLAHKVRGMRKLWLKGVDTKEMASDWRPLLVIANLKSGSSTASEVIALFRYVLHPLQVMELGSKGPEESLRWALKMAPKQCRILVAGGDGTVGWILNTIIRMNIEPMPEVGVLPLGTGNDLSRVLGWSGEPPSSLNATEYLQDIKDAESILLDRWLLEIERCPYRFPLKRPPHKSVFMYNYFSIGVDALVTLNFHKARESPFYVLSNRLINKMLYLCFGSHQVFIQDCAGLDKQMEVYLDGVKLELPDLQSIVFLNIDSWGAGVKLWEMSKSTESENLHSTSDGMLEVLGVVSSFHIAQMQCGIRKPLRLGQAKEIRVKLLANCPVQADGEPWVQTPCEIKISAKGQAKMLRKRVKCNKNIFKELKKN